MPDTLIMFKHTSSISFLLLIFPKYGEERGFEITYKCWFLSKLSMCLVTHSHKNSQHEIRLQTSRLYSEWVNSVKNNLDFF